MKDEFTPGPWGRGYGNYVYSKGRLIATCQPLNGTVDELDEAFANAKLCAAAPELLQIAEYALEWIDAVPDEVAARLPVMPGFDREWANEVIRKVRSK